MAKTKESDTEEQLGRGLMAAMGRAGVLDYAEVARLAGLDPRTVRGLHAGTTVDVLLAISEALKCDVSELTRELGSTAR